MDNSNIISEEKEPLQGPSSQPPSTTEIALTTINSLPQAPERVNDKREAIEGVTSNLNVAPTDILNSLYNASDSVNIIIKADRKGDPFTGDRKSITCIQFDSIEDDLMQHNLQHRGIYFAVNHGGFDDRSISRINANFISMTSGSVNDQMQKIQSFPLEPSMIVSNGDSIDAYWLVDAEDVSIFSSVQKGLAKRFCGESACVHKSHCMRLPGYYNCSLNQSVLITVERFHPELHYSVDDLITALGDDYVAEPDSADDTTNAAQPEGTEMGLTMVTQTCSYVQECASNASTINDTQMDSLLTNLAPFEGGRDSLHTYASQRPGYDSASFDKKISKCLSDSTVPTTCEQIEAQGFICQKKADGVCTCKSPKEKAYKPISIDEVRALLQIQPITGSDIEDIQTAEKFVMDYLYNLDSGLAEAIITRDLKKQFNLNSADCKALVKTYNKRAKEYHLAMLTKNKSSQTAKIPKWYTIGDKGYAFLPDILANYCAEEKAVFCIEDTFYLYENGVYKEISKKKAKKILRKHMLLGTIKSAQISDALEQWSIETQKDAKELNANPYLINVRNGLYNIMDDSFIQHNEKILMTTQIPVNYIPGATCPRFMRFLDEALEPNQIPLVQEWLGYTLVPLNRAQKALLIVGEGNTGKSVLLRTIVEILLGRENVSNVAIQDLKERFKPAELFGKLANVFADLPKTNMSDNGMFKALTGEDYITVERKNEHPFAFQNKATLVFSCNQLPQNYGDRSNGFYRRLCIVEFNRVVPEDKRDPELIEKFRAEADGIFLFAIEGLRRLISNKYVFSEMQTNRDAVDAYRQDANSVLSFVHECCTVNDSVTSNRQRVFEDYRQYCYDYDLKQFSQRRFNAEIEANFPGVEKTETPDRTERIWKGLCLKSTER